MKILQLASYYAPTIGGMETVLKELAEGLVASGDQVTVLCSSANLRAADQTTGGVRVLRSPSVGRVLSQPITPLLPITLLRLYGAFDITHLHMPNPLAEAAILSLPRSTPFIVTYHADIIRQKALRPFYGPIRQAVLARSRRIVVPTQNHIEFSEILPGFSEKCAVVPFGISPDRYRMSEQSTELVRQLKERYGRFVLFVGRLVYYKGVVELIESIRDVDAKLVVVGDGPLRAAIEARVATLGLGARVSLVGAVDQSALNAYFAACEVLVLPSVSRSEGFGMTLLEGMLFGKPLVTTRLQSGVQFVNEEGRTGFQVPVRDPAALATALNRLLSDDVLRAAMGAAGRSRMETVFSQRQMISGYRAIYAQALA